MTARGAVPAQEQLDDPVQVRGRQAAREPDPPPNRGMNIPRQELQLQQQRRALFDHHPDKSSPRVRHAKACPRFVRGSMNSVTRARHDELAIAARDAFSIEIRAVAAEIVARPRHARHTRQEMPRVSATRSPVSKPVTQARRLNRAGDLVAHDARRMRIGKMPTGSGGSCPLTPHLVHAAPAAGMTRLAMRSRCHRASPKLYSSSLPRFK